MHYFRPFCALIAGLLFFTSSVTAQHILEIPEGMIGVCSVRVSGPDQKLVTIKSLLETFESSTCTTSTVTGGPTMITPTSPGVYNLQPGVYSIESRWLSTCPVDEGAPMMELKRSICQVNTKIYTFSTPAGGTSSITIEMISGSGGGGGRNAAASTNRSRGCCCGR